MTCSWCLFLLGIWASFTITDWKMIDNYMKKPFMCSIGSTVICFKMGHIDHIFRFMVETRTEKPNIATKVNVNWYTVPTAIMLREYLLFFVVWLLFQDLFTIFRLILHCLLYRQNKRFQKDYISIIVLFSWFWSKFLVFSNVLWMPKYNSIDISIENYM